MQAYPQTRDAALARTYAHIAELNGIITNHAPHAKKGIARFLLNAENRALEILLNPEIYDHSQVKKRMMTE